jgi:hypothetical protein
VTMNTTVISWDVKQSVGYLQIFQKYMFSPSSSTLKIDAISYSESSVTAYQTTRHHILEESILNNYYWFKFYSNIQEHSQRMLFKRLKENCKQRNQSNIAA